MKEFYIYFRGKTLVKSHSIIIILVTFLAFTQTACQQFSTEEKVVNTNDLSQNDTNLNNDDAPNPEVENPESETEAITTGGSGGAKGWSTGSCGNQSYITYVPNSYNPTQGAAVIVAFHGLGDTKENFANTLSFTNWPAVADSEGIILVVPQPLNTTRLSFLHFNGTSFDGVSTQNEVDQALDCVYYGVGDKFNINTEEIYWLGFSEGASFANYALISKSKEIKAIIPYAGIVNPNGRVMTRKTPIYFIAGTLDFSYDSIVLYSQDWKDMGHPVEQKWVNNVTHSFSTLNMMVPATTVWQWLQQNPGSPVTSSYEP